MDVKAVKFSTWTYCAIANGVISDWNDAAITADNGGTSLTGGISQPITFYFRSDSSGTSYQYTNHLNTACNVTFGAPYNAPPYGSSSRSAAWSYGVNSTWPGPGSTNFPNAHFIGENGNPGVLAAIQATPYGTGYVEGAYAKSANPPVGQAYLQNGQNSQRRDLRQPEEPARGRERRSKHVERQEHHLRRGQRRSAARHEHPVVHSVR